MNVNQVYGLLNSKIKGLASGVKNIAINEDGSLNFITSSDEIIKIQVPNMHIHKNKAVLDGITLEKIEEWNDKIPVNGREIELQKANEYIQWRYVGQNSWKNLVSLSELKGEQGIQGVQGQQGTKGDRGEKGDDNYELWIRQGNEGTVDDYFATLRGRNGVTPNITIGTVTTLEAGQEATATITGDKENPILNLGIPKGQDGQGGGSGEGSSGGTSIDDNTVSSTKTWSSAKIEDFVLDNVGAIWQDINGLPQVNDTLEGFLRDVEILGNTIQNPDDLSDIQHLGVWNEEKQGYEIEIKVSNSLNSEDLNYEEYKTTILLPCQPMKVGDISDRLYWDNAKGRYIIEKYIFKETIDNTETFKWQKDSDLTFTTRFKGSMPSTTKFPFVGGGWVVINKYFTNKFKPSLPATDEADKISFGGAIPNRGIRVKKEIGTTLEEFLSSFDNFDVYFVANTPEIIETNIREQLKLPTYLNSTYITVSGGVQGSIKAKAPINGSAIIEGIVKENKELKTTNKLQDELINISLLATDEMFIMLEPLLTQNISLNMKGGDRMVEMYAAMVIRKLKTIDEIPERYREQVRVLLSELEK